MEKNLSILTSVNERQNREKDYGIKSTNEDATMMIETDYCKSYGIFVPNENIFNLNQKLGLLKGIMVYLGSS